MKISIIVPVYNIENYISKCIESLVLQNYDDMEIILVDDGSQDNSPHICDNWASKYKNIQVIHKSNGGLSSARNAGMQVANGRYILFIDGDDYLECDTIETLVNIIEKTKADIIQFGYEEVNEYDPYKKIEKSSNKFNDSLYKESNKYKFYENLYKLGGVAASACTKLIRAELAKSLQFKIGILHEDEEFTTRLLAVCNTVVYINNYKPYKYVMRKGSIIHNTFKAKRVYDISNIMEERIELLKKLKYNILVKKFASKYFINLLLLYIDARNAHDYETCKFIDAKASFIVSNYNLQLFSVNYIIALIYKMGISGASIYYRIRNIYKRII